MRQCVKVFLPKTHQTREDADEALEKLYHG